ncbi:MAG TPA: hypothetical protein VGQ58_04540 [Candidatus Limnocylindrales bacterium]|jgi:hypothetical protein|nr:hypothetical protein [Candidatus Limnocylindrales bacterium]
MSQTPDAAARAFMSAWKARRWTGMHSALQVRRRSRVDRNRLEALFGSKALLTWSIVASTEKAPALVEVRVAVLYRIGAARFRRNVLLNVIREDRAGMPAPPDVGPGEWGVNEISALREESVP